MLPYAWASLQKPPRTSLVTWPKATNTCPVVRPAAGRALHTGSGRSGDWSPFWGNHTVSICLLGWPRLQHLQPRIQASLKVLRGDILTCRDQAPHSFLPCASSRALQSSSFLSSLQYRCTTRPAVLSYYHKSLPPSTFPPLLKCQMSQEDRSAGSQETPHLLTGLTAPGWYLDPCLACAVNG